MCIRDRVNIIIRYIIFFIYFLLNKLEQSKSNTNENCNDMRKNVVLDEELTNDDDDFENNENSIENSNVIENVVSESDTSVSYTHLKGVVGTSSSPVLLGVLAMRFFLF